MVEHDVLVRLLGKRTDRRNHRGEEMRSWRRIMSLMDAAAYFIRAFSCFERSAETSDMIASHRQSIAAMYEVAVVLRSVLGSRSARNILNSHGETPSSAGGTAASVESEEDGSRTPLSAKRTLDDIFNFLIPSGVMIERGLVRVTCAVPEEV